MQRRRPVERVTWFEAIEYCNKFSERKGLTPVYTINRTLGRMQQGMFGPPGPLDWILTVSVNRE